MTTMLGMSMRFHVVVDTFNLGAWSSCKGLGLTADLKKFHENGSYLYEHILFADVKYGTLTLERAMDKTNSPKLQQWLSTMLRDSQPGALTSTTAGKSATITLLDSTWQPVMTWTLRGVFPVAWSGPDMSATKTEVAIEKLQLAHEGFLQPTTNVRAQLAPLAGGGTPLAFSFNPKTVKVSKATSTEGRRTLVANSFEDAVKSVGNLAIDLTGVQFTGTTTKANVDKLIGWATPAAAGVVPGGGSRPAGGSGGSGGGGGLTRAPRGYQGKGTIYNLPVLNFTWGSGFTYKVVLQKVDATYERFASTGAPVWATCTLSLKEYTETQPSQNPTSGGPAGRTRHQLVAGDSVIRVATDSYGTPDAWRIVAEANGLDDPLRVRPGRVLQLPGLEELEAEAES